MPEGRLAVAADGSQDRVARPSAALGWIFFSSLSTLAVLLCMARVDLPVAAFVSARLRRGPLFEITSSALGTLSLVAVLAPGFLVASGMAVLSGRRISRFMRTLLVSSWSVVWALSATIVLKRLFGRSSIDPLHLARSVYDFHPLGGGWGHEAFPSGTTTIASAILSVLWIRLPPSRFPGACLLAIVSAALVATNSHWISDIVAGVFFGTTIGWMTARLQGDDEQPGAPTK